MSPKKDLSKQDDDDTELTNSQTQFTSIASAADDVSPMNPFDSPVDDEIKSPLEDVDNNEGGTDLSSNANASFTTSISIGADHTVSPVNPFDSPDSLERKIREKKGGGGNDVLSDSKRCLDDIFKNESDDDYSQYPDNNSPMQHPYVQEHEGEQEITEGCQEGVNEMKDICENEHDNNRNTTSTNRDSTMWDDNSSDNSSQYDDDERRINDEQIFWDNRYCYCLLRFLHRVCNQHIHPPCITNLSHPHLPKCLERISPRTRRIICRSLIITFMIITITFTLLDLLILHKYLHVWLNSTLAWLTKHPVSGGVAFIGIFLLGSLCFFPVALLSLGAGYVYIELYGVGLGICVAFVVCYVGCLVGAAVCFARSRYLMRVLVERFSVKYPIVRSVDRAFETMGFRLFLLLRLSPAMPFNALNYIGGITAISFRNYWWATCAGIAPNILWTIFVGATFGTVNAHGVDGNKEFDQNSVRKGVVLGLGIGLGVMGLVGTGIYARKELTKIVIAEQRERAMEEPVVLEMSHNYLMDGECEAIPEEGEDGSLSFEDLENPQLGDDTIDDYNDPESSLRSSVTLGMSAISSNTHRSDSSSPGRQRRMQQRSWTPDTVAAELPILPKVLHRYLSPIRTLESSESNNLTSDFEGNAETTIAAPLTPVDDSNRRRDQYLSASMPPFAGQDNFSFDSEDEFDSEEDDAEGCSSVEKASPTSPTRRHTLQHTSFENIKTALASRRAADEHNRPRACSYPIDDDIMEGLADIDETKVLSHGDSPSKKDDTSQIMMTPIGVSREQKGNRRRCSTDPTDRGGHYSASAMANINKREGRGSSSATKRRQQSPLWTPSKKSLRKRHSFDDVARNETPSPQQHLHQTNNNRQQDHHDERDARSSSLSFPQQQQDDDEDDNGARSSSMPFEYSPSANHLELNIGNDNSGSNEDEDEPSREWFWIWA